MADAVRFKSTKFWSCLLVSNFRMLSRQKTSPPGFFRRLGELSFGSLFSVDVLANSEAIRMRNGEKKDIDIV